MVIKEDFSYIDSFSKLLIENGFGIYLVHSYCFNRYFSDEQMEENRREAERLSSDRKAWEKRCDDSHYAFYEVAKKMMEALGAQYKIYQYNSDDYKNKDLFFYSNKGWNNREWFDYCTLSLHDDYNINIQQNRELKKWLIKWNGDIDNVINCRIQYQACINKEKVSAFVKNYIDTILNKMIIYGFTEGKVKWVDCNNEYGFFKKGAKKYYTPLNDISLMELLVQQKIILFN